MLGKKKTRAPRVLDVWHSKDSKTGQIEAFKVADWYADNGKTADEDQRRPPIAVFPVSGVANEADQRRRALALLAYLQKEQAVQTAVQALDMDN
jgi:hypothetical protein